MEITIKHAAAVCEESHSHLSKVVHTMSFFSMPVHRLNFSTSTGVINLNVDKVEGICDVDLKYYHYILWHYCDFAINVTIRSIYLR